MRLMVVWHAGESLGDPVGLGLLDPLWVAVDEIPPDVAFADRIAAENDGGAGATERGRNLRAEHRELTRRVRWAVSR